MSTDDTRHIEAPVATRSPGPQILERARLLSLDQGQPILVAEAPSGYGKTVLARAWMRRAPKEARSLWVSLDPAARDPAVFLDRLAVALGVEGVYERETGIDDEADRAERFARLAERLAAEPQPLRLVLDDVHHLAGSPSRVYLMRLLLGASARLRIFLTLQPVALEAGLGELTAQGRVCWIHMAALALTREELGAFAEARGYRGSCQHLDGLMQATAGWPALVQMALALPPDQGVLELGRIAGVGPIREYIYERFLTRVDGADRALLWTLACIGSGPLRLLRALCADPGDQDARLSHLQALGIAQPEEPAPEPSVRLHPLVRESVLRVFAAAAARSKAQILAEAADWYWAQHRGAASVHALIEAGGEFLPAARDRLLILGRDLIYRSGQHQTLIELAERWELAAGTHDHELDRVAVWALTFQRRFAAARDRLERSLDGQPEPTQADEAHLQRGLMAALQDDYQAGGQFAHEWLQAQPRTLSFHKGAAWTIYAYRLKCEGDIPGCLSALREAHAAFSHVQSVYGTVWACLVGALAQIRLGRYRDALAEIEQGLRRCSDTPGFGGQRAMLRAIEAFVRYERDELSTVRDVLDEALPLLSDQGLVETLVLGFSAAARLRASTGNLGAALDLLSDAERGGEERQFRRLSSGLRAERALLLARNGAWDQARRSAEFAQYHLTHEAAATAPERAARLRARLALADGDAELARQIIRPALEQSRASHLLYKQCELLVLSALTEDLAGNEVGAFAAIRESLTLARSESYRRVIVDEGTELHALIRRWLQSQPASAAHRNEAGWAETLLSANEPPRTDGRSQPRVLIESLNPREQQVLALLAEGLSNAEIAARCFLVEGTVKWHLHNLYGKLGVRSRTAALRAAQSLGLLGT